MKKILAFFTSFSLVVIGANSVVACGYWKQTTDYYSRDSIKGLDKIFMLDQDLASSASDEWINEKITNYIKEKIVFNSKKISLGTDFDIIVNENDNEISINKDYKRISKNNSLDGGNNGLVGQELLVGSSMVVISKSESKFLKANESFQVYFKKDFTYLKGIVPEEEKLRTIEKGQEIKTEMLAEIERWAPEAELDIDFSFKSNSELTTIETVGSWSLDFFNNSKTTFGSGVDFNVGIPDYDLSSLEGQFDYEISSYQAVRKTIESNVQRKLSRDGFNAILNKDYFMDFIPYDEFDQVMQIGSYRVWAAENSTVLKGSFDINIYVLIDLSKYEKYGIYDRGVEIKNEILQKIEVHYPHLTADVDYKFSRYLFDPNNNVFEIEDNNKAIEKFWTLKSLNKNIRFWEQGGFDGEVYFDNRIDLSQLNAKGKDRLNFKIDEKEITREVIYNGIDSRINRIVPKEWGKAIAGLDYLIPNWNFDENGNTADKGFYKIYAGSETNLFIGMFEMLLWIIALADPGTE